jgi:RimJ/RimL family protein N-acetyltransferase
VISNKSGLPIGHAEIYLSADSAKIGRILVGSKQERGKGIGQMIVHLLLDYIFSHLQRNLVELNVFDWNTVAIKCYEKVGFTINPGKKLERTIKDKTWIAINMTIDKSAYTDRRLGENNSFS